MAIGYDDEFDYLDDENTSDADESFAPKIKGANKSATAEDNVAEKKVEEKIKSDDIADEQEKPKREFESQIYIVKVTTNKENKEIGRAHV